MLAALFGGKTQDEKTQDEGISLRVKDTKNPNVKRFVVEGVRNPFGVRGDFEVEYRQGEGISDAIRGRAQAGQDSPLARDFLTQNAVAVMISQTDGQGEIRITAGSWPQDYLNGVRAYLEHVLKTGETPVFTQAFSPPEAFNPGKAVREARQSGKAGRDVPDKVLEGVLKTIEKAAPILRKDAGAINLAQIVQGNQRGSYVVSLHMAGACGGCPSSGQTMAALRGILKDKYKIDAVFQPASAPPGPAPRFG